MSGRKLRYSTTMPDGRTLEFEPTGPTPTEGTLRIDGEDVKRVEADRAWNAQPYEWQRGRSLEQALRFWTGS